MTDSPTYADWILRDRPRWLSGLRDGWGERWLRSLGSVLDLVVEGALEALRAGMVSRSPDDALPYHAAERNLEQYPSETSDSWRERLGRAWDQWEQAGREDGLEYQLNRYGIEHVEVIDAKTDIYTGTQPWSSQFIVVLGDGVSAGSLPWSGLTMPFTPDDKGSVTLGSTATAAEVAAVRAIVRKWKSAHAQTVAIVLRFVGGTVTPPLYPFDPANAICPWIAANARLGLGILTMPFVTYGYREDLQ